MARLSWISIDKRRAIVALGLSPPPHHLSPSSTTHFLLLESVGALRALSSARMAWSKGRINLWADCVVRKIGDPAYLPPTSSKHRLTFCSVIFAEDAMSFLRKVAVAGIKPWVSKVGGSNLEKILRGNVCNEDSFQVSPFVLRFFGRGHIESIRELSKISFHSYIRRGNHTRIGN